ncbi:Ubiquitin-specific-processing protease 12, partial [Hyphodiscus hymeniophilus]
SFLTTLLPHVTKALQRQRTFTTSSQKKRKLSPQHIPGQASDSNPDIPLNSVESRDSQSPSDLPRLDFPTNDGTHIPPHIPAHLQNSSSLAALDYTSSAASSPSAAYAGLSIEGERGGDPSASELRQGSLAPQDQDARSQSPLLPFAHRAIMGGAADLPQRSSSPLKRRASDLEEGRSSQKDDVDMITVPESTLSASPDTPMRPGRAQSIDMLRDEVVDGVKPTVTASEDQVAFGAFNLHLLKIIPLEAPPSIDYQIKTVTTLYEAEGEKQPEEGDITYLVSKQWLERVLSRGSEARQKSKMEPEGEIGPVDNSDIIERIFTDFAQTEFAQLKDGLGMDSYVLFPQTAWELVDAWYGLKPGQIPIIRTAHNTNPNKFGIPNMQYELNPPVFTIHRLWSEQADAKAHLLSVPIKTNNGPAPVLVLSRSTKNVKFLQMIKQAAGVDQKRKIRFWRVPRVQPAAEPPATNTVTPPASPPNSNPEGISGQQGALPKLLIDVDTFGKLEGRERVEIDDFSVDQNYNGSSDIALTGLGDSQSIIIDESVTDHDYVSNYSAKLSTKSTAVTKSGALVPHSASQTNSGRTSPAPSGPMTRGRAQKNGRTPGTVGLSNLGNTCYMNSALQCVRSVQELTQYFLSGAASSEINTDNPLGWNGDIAKAYHHLLAEIYNSKGHSVVPRAFKNTIGRHAPSFSGYGQQDSQEFLGFLLDGLQEDLSRVKKKPYIEKPDSTDEMVNDAEAIREMAAKVWEITKKRDDSVIADLFTGMYKSTLVCPICAKVSITFDPFNNVSLTLPIANSWSHPIYFFPLNDKPIIINVDIDKQATILAMKHYLSKKTGIPVERLFVAEEFKSKFYKVFKDLNVASEDIGSNDSVAVYELEAKPTNWPSPNNEKAKKNKYGSNSDTEEIPNWDSPLAEKMLVPVFYRRPNNERSRYGSKKPWEVMPVPHYIVVTAEEARSEDLIKRKILEKLATFTTYRGLQEEYETNDSVADSIDPDLVLTTGSDSSGDSKVVANSIDGEDELVDVTMKEPNGIRESVEKESVKPSEVDPSNPMGFNKRRPKFMEPGSFLDGDFQNLFELSFFAGKELVPTGWNAVDDDKKYPRLSSRTAGMIQTGGESETDQEMTNGHDDSESGNEDGDAPHSAVTNVTRMTDEDESDEDDPIAALPPPPNNRALPLRQATSKSGVRVGHKKNRPHRPQTYSRKGNRQAQKLSQNRNFDDQDDPDDQDAHDDGPLIRLGEGIVVDWNADAFSNMFEAASPSDDFRGQSTWSAIPTYVDHELAAKKEARAKRRKNGISLDDCLDEFGKEEVLSEMDTWYCPRCKEHRRATKKFELWKTPDILVMHLKRFSNSGWRREKLDVLVDFPIENLDLTSRVIETEDGKSEIYDLFAVDDHWGGLGGGHYTAFAKNYEDQKWYEYNDSSVSEVKDVRKVVSASAYLLFYRRRSEGLLGGTRFLEILGEYEKPETSEEDEAEADSGEGRGLDAKSSLRGSSSALTGVGAALHQTSGSGTGMGQMTTVNPQDLDALPAYQTHENDDEGVPLIESDTMMNDGLGIRNSIEGEDEGIDMGGYNTMNLDDQGNVGFSSASNWNWGSLENLNTNDRQVDTRISGTGSEIDLNETGLDVDGSDIVQHNSSASTSSIRGRLEDFDNAIPMGDDGDPFEEPSPVPDMDPDQLDTIELHRELLEAHGATQFQVHAPTEEDEIDEPATEIHLDPNDDLKMD